MNTADNTLKLLQEHNYSGKRGVHHSALGERCFQVNSELCSGISSFKSVNDPTEALRVSRAAVNTQRPSQHHQKMKVSPATQGLELGGPGCQVLTRHL